MMDRTACVAVAVLATFPLSAQQLFVEHRLAHLPETPLSLPRPEARDLDGDGRPEIVVTLIDEGLVVVEGDGGFCFGDRRRSLAPASDAISAIAVADMDGDGDEDICASGQNGLVVFFAEGGGTWRRGPWQIGSAQRARDVVVLDADGDGDMDLAANSSGGAWLILNDGTGNLGLAPTGSLVPVPYSSLASADLDADGDADLVGGSGKVQATRILINDGTGRFLDETNARIQDGGATRRITIGDIDGDGDPDLFVAKRFGDRLYLNDGAGVFSDASGRLTAVDEETRDALIADLDGDGRPDIVSAYVGRLLVQRNTGNADFRPQWITNGILNVRIAAFDADGDGVAEILASSGIGFDSLLAGLPDESWVELAGTTLAEPRPGLTARVALADLDGDGDLDTIVGGDGFRSTRIRALRNIGGNRMVPWPESGIEVTGFAAALLAFDADGDGDLDVFAPGGGGSTPPPFWINDGTGRFTEEGATRFPGVESSDFRFAVAGDVDGDGDIDVLRTGDRLNNAVFFNDGRGRFVASTAGAPGGGFSDLEIALGDVDGDGDLDAVGNWSFRAPQLWRNDGSGRFELVSDAFVPPPTETAGPTPTLIDADGDGDLDAVWNGSLRSTLYRNDGTGSFTAAGALPGAPGESLWARLAADIDQDGDADLIGLRRRTRPALPEILVNDGSGNFTLGSDLVRFGPRRGEAFALAVGDTDGDDDVDIVVGTDGNDILLTNRTIDLALRRQPTIGGSLELLVADRRTPVALFGIAVPLISDGTARTSIPGIGTLGLNPAAIVAGDPLLIAPGSRPTALTIPMPADPSLLGARVFVQSLILHPLQPTRFSGVVPVRVL